MKKLVLCKHNSSIFFQCLRQFFPPSTPPWAGWSVSGSIPGTMGPFSLPCSTYNTRPMQILFLDSLLYSLFSILHQDIKYGTCPIQIRLNEIWTDTAKKQDEMVSCILPLLFNSLTPIIFVIWYFLTRMLVMCGLNNTICGKCRVTTISH